MNFLEKDLETIIWENYDACEQRGLAIKTATYNHGRRFRQMNLMPAGIADLVNIYYDRFYKELYIQVIECKRQVVNADTYLQAKRYAAALLDIIANAEIAHIKKHVEIILIGASINTDSPWANAIGQDDSCSSFIYKYGVDGIKFIDCSIHWWAASSSLGTTNEIVDRYDIGGYVLDKQALHRSDELARGEYLAPLRITPDGVLINSHYTDFDTYGPAH